MTFANFPFLREKASMSPHIWKSWFRIHVLNLLALSHVVHSVPNMDGEWKSNVKTLIFSSRDAFFRKERYCFSEFGMGFDFHTSNLDGKEAPVLRQRKKKSETISVCTLDRNYRFKAVAKKNVLTFLRDASLRNLFYAKLHIEHKCKVDGTSPRETMTSRVRKKQKLLALFYGGGVFAFSCSRSNLFRNPWLQKVRWLDDIVLKNSWTETSSIFWENHF